MKAAVECIAAIMWKPGQMPVFYRWITESHCWIFPYDRCVWDIAIKNLAIQISVFYLIARSYRNLAIQMSVFYPIARSHGNLAIKIARTYANLAIQISVFYLIARSWNRRVRHLHMITAVSESSQRSYANLQVIEMSLFYPITPSRNRTVYRFGYDRCGSLNTFTSIERSLSSLAII